MDRVRCPRRAGETGKEKEVQVDRQREKQDSDGINSLRASETWKE